MKEQYNTKTGKAYQGNNQTTLLLAKKEKGFTADDWGTFIQWRDQGRKIKKGEEGTKILIVGKTTDEDGNEKTAVFYKTIFNRDQTI